MYHSLVDLALTEHTHTTVSLTMFTIPPLLVFFFLCKCCWSTTDIHRRVTEASVELSAFLRILKVSGCKFRSGKPTFLTVSYMAFLTFSRQIPVFSPQIGLSRSL